MSPNDSCPYFFDDNHHIQRLLPLLYSIANPGSDGRSRHSLPSPRPPRFTSPHWSSRLESTNGQEQGMPRPTFKKHTLGNPLLPEPGVVLPPGPSSYPIFRSAHTETTRQNTQGSCKTINDACVTMYRHIEIHEFSVQGFCRSVFEAKEAERCEIEFIHCPKFKIRLRGLLDVEIRKRKYPSGGVGGTTDYLIVEVMGRRSKRFVKYANSILHPVPHSPKSTQVQRGGIIDTRDHQKKGSDFLLGESLTFASPGKSYDSILDRESLVTSALTAESCDSSMTTESSCNNCSQPQGHESQLDGPPASVLTAVDLVSQEQTVSFENAQEVPVPQLENRSEFSWNGPSVVPSELEKDDPPLAFCNDLSEVHAASKAKTEQDNTVPLNCHAELSVNLKGQDNRPYQGDMTIFQAEPLVERTSTGVCRPIAPVYAFTEKRVIKDAIKEVRKRIGSDIHVVEEIANRDRFNAFFGIGCTPILHFIGHADEQRGLELEDGNFELDLLKAKDLEELFASGKGRLKLVVLSCCFSSAVREALKNAGIPLLVYSDGPLSNEAAAVFARSFYFTLFSQSCLCQSTVDRAFQQAQLAVRLSGLNKEKFRFFHTNDDSSTSFSAPSSSRQSIGTIVEADLPTLPQVFLGAQHNKYKVLQKVERHRVVFLQGETGIGRRTLAKAVSSHIRRRAHIFAIDGVFWFPPLPSAKDDVSVKLRTLHRKMVYAKEYTEAEIAETSGEVVTALKKTKHALLSVDAQGLSPSSIRTLDGFLEILLNGSNVQLLLVYPQHHKTHGHKIPLVAHGFAECVSLDPLDLRSSVGLFGVWCPFVRPPLDIQCPQELADILAPQERETAVTPRARMYPPFQEIFRTIGSGVPERIIDKAKTMNRTQYNDLLLLGFKNIVSSKNTEPLAEIEKEIEYESERKQELIKEKEFLIADHSKRKLEALRRRRDLLPTLQDLRSRETFLCLYREQMLLEEDYMVVHDIESELDLVKKRIKTEATEM